MKMKSDKAITLVALIITIIVLLILAGVTLNMVLGDNGLINKAQSSVDKYKESAENEQKLLNEIEEYIGTKGTNGKKEGELTLSATSGTVVLGTPGSFTVTGNTSGGAISAASDNTSVADVSVSGNTITVTPKAVGTATITVTSAATTNYNAKSATYTVTVYRPYSVGESVTISGNDFYVIGDDGTNVTLLHKSTISTATWANAKSQASTFGSNLGGTGRLMTKAEAEGVAASYRNIGSTYWLADAYDSSHAWCVYDGGYFGNHNYDNDTSYSNGVRPVVVISKSKL